MADTPYISVIIPTCGRPKSLLQCVASVLENGYENFEILVIDQDSDQRLKRYLPQHFPNQPQLNYFFLEKAGASRARNFGIEVAQGKIVAFIDDDAIADTSWLEGIEEAFTVANPKPALIGGRIEPIWPNNKPGWYPPEREFMLGLYNIGDTMRPMPEFDQPIGANMAGLRDLVINLGGFDENLGPNYFRKHPMLTGEETILGQRAKKAGHKLYYQPKALVYHRISEVKLTRSYFLRRHFWEGVTAIHKIYLMGELGSDKFHHARYHSKQVARSIGRFLWPSFRSKYPPPYAPIRMLALSGAWYSFGVLFGLFTLRGSVDLKDNPRKCASA